MGHSPQRDPGAEPMVGGGLGESLLAFGHPTKATKFAVLTVSGKVYLLYSIAPPGNESTKLPTAGKWTQ